MADKHDPWKAVTRREALGTSLYLVGGAALGTLGLGLAGCRKTAPITPARGVALKVPEMSRAVQRVVKGVRRREGAGFIVRRPFPQEELELVDPFLLLDELGPIRYGPGEAVGAPDHPHRGFETVSYVLDGRLHHRDSMGHDGVIGRGGVQWMTAGSGIVHSEMPPKDVIAHGGRTHGFQLWVNLPRDLKMIKPHYQELQADGVPLIQDPSKRATGRIIAGAAFGVKGAIRTTLPTHYQHWTLDPGAQVDLPIPRAQQVSAFVFRGTAHLGKDAKAVTSGGLAIFGPGEAIRLGAKHDGKGAELLLMAAAPLKEPVARYGPFVMNTQAELRQAFADYRAGKMGRIPPAKS
jgi:redox-sensitive bicupin YhaK (pirin superfamily)